MDSDKEPLADQQDKLVDREIAELKAQLKRSKRRELEALRAELKKRESIEQHREQPPSEDEGTEESSGDYSFEKGHQTKGGKRRRRNRFQRAKARKQVFAETKLVKSLEPKGKATPSMSEPPSKVAKLREVVQYNQNLQGRGAGRGNEGKGTKGKGTEHDLPHWGWDPTREHP